MPKKENMETVNVVSLDKKKGKIEFAKDWVRENKKYAAAAVVASVALLGSGGYGVYSLVNDDVDQVKENVVPHRDFLDGSQNDLPKAKVIKGEGKGTITTIDHVQGGKPVSAPIVGIDGIGGETGATLPPPENIGQVGHYVRSAPFGVDGKGSSVITSHVNYNGITGYGSVFTTLKKGDPITITKDNGEEIHYVVNEDPINVNKSDPGYVQKTVDTINKMNGKNILVMVTCGGEYLGANSPLGYADNIVVTADLVPDFEGKKIKDFSKDE